MMTTDRPAQHRAMDMALAAAVQLALTPMAVSRSSDGTRVQPRQQRHQRTEPIPTAQATVHRPHHTPTEPRRLPSKPTVHTVPFKPSQLLHPHHHQPLRTAALRRQPPLQLHQLLHTTRLRTTLPTIFNTIRPWQQLRPNPPTGHKLRPLMLLPVGKRLPPKKLTHTHHC